MKKRVIAAVLALIVLLAGAWLFLRGRRGADSPLAGNLVRNGDFSAVSSGMPDVGHLARRFFSGGRDAGRHALRAGGERRAQRRAL